VVFLNTHLTENLLRNIRVNFLKNRLRFERIVVMSLWPRLFGPPCKWHPSLAVFPEWPRVVTTVLLRKKTDETKAVTFLYASCTPLTGQLNSCKAEASKFSLDYN